MPPANPDMQRDLGRAEGRLGALERDVGAIRSGMDKQDEKLARIETLLAETRGGWKVLMGAGAAGAALATVFAKLLPFIPFGK